MSTLFAEVVAVDDVIGIAKDIALNGYASYEEMINSRKKNALIISL
ncbi:hypothetical protein [Methanosalsum natronophilum]|nr:hypothetical protein [Methanosalsum natronophilum]MCS3924080.1 hypothetical protein [Methanosalsum natronophilum]